MEGNNLRVDEVKNARKQLSKFHDKLFGFQDCWIHLEYILSLIHDNPHYTQQIEKLHDKVLTEYFQIYNLYRGFPNTKEELIEIIKLPREGNPWAYLYNAFDLDHFEDFTVLLTTPQVNYDGYSGQLYKEYKDENEIFKLSFITKSVKPGQTNENKIENTLCNFGKHEGVKYKNIPLKYLLWMLRIDHTQVENSMYEIIRRIRSEADLMKKFEFEPDQIQLFHQIIKKDLQNNHNKMTKHKPSKPAKSKKTKRSKSNKSKKTRKNRKRRRK